MADTEALVGELLKDENNKLVTVAKESGLAEQKQHMLLASFGEYFTSALTIINQSQDLEVTSEDQKDEIEQASIARKELKKLRCEAENQRKSLKESALREGQAIDKMFNVIKEIIKPEEDRLEQHEKFAERMAAERFARTCAERKARLLEYVEDAGFYKYENLSDDAFDQLIKQLEDARVAREKAEREAAEAAEAERQRLEAERIAREKATAEEAERIRKENEKLKAEAAAREAEIAKQRVAEEKRLQAERLEQNRKIAAERAKAEEERKKREAIEAEQRAKAEEQAKAKAEAAEAERQALLAPDKEKLVKFADSIAQIEAPLVSDDKARDLITATKRYLDQVSDNLRQKAKLL